MNERFSRSKAIAKKELAATKKNNDPVVVTVDVGNSHTVVGIFRGDEICEYWRLTTRSVATSDEVMLRISGLVRSSSVKVSDVVALGLSSVVPILERPWVKALHFVFRKPVQVVSDRNCLGLKIAYANPSLLGADRICNAIALREMGLKTGVVVDMGTATSFDVMKNGEFLGGMIIPGINASLDVLTQKAARLMPVTLDWPEHFIASDTENAIRAGLLYGFTGQLEYLLAGIQKELNLKKPAPVYATGGWSSLLMERTQVIDSYDPYLTLKGIRAVALKGQGGQI